MSERIGIICGWEESFPRAFIEKVNQTPGFQAEFAKLGGITETHKHPYRVLIDRISQEVEYYRIALKNAALRGTYVINDPHWWSADDKFFGYSLCPEIGVRVPRTVLLPQHSYIPAIDPKRSLRNLEFPLDWENIISYIGFPAVLKPATGGGWKQVSIVHNINELWTAYNASGTTPMTLQQYIDFDDYTRCICIGKNFILPIKYAPKAPFHERYVEAENFMSKELEQKVLDGCFAINSALGYDMNSVEFAIKDGVPYAIDFTNPAPDFDIHSIRPRYFNMVVDEMARFAIQCAREGRQNYGGYAFRRQIEKPATRAAAGAKGSKRAS